MDAPNGPREAKLGTRVAVCRTFYVRGTSSATAVPQCASVLSVRCPRWSAAAKLAKFLSGRKPSNAATVQRSFADSSDLQVDFKSRRQQSSACLRDVAFRSRGGRQSSLTRRLTSGVVE